jgi:hypothetical protein
VGREQGIAELEQIPEWGEIFEGRERLFRQSLQKINGT